MTKINTISNFQIAKRPINSLYNKTNQQQLKISFTQKPDTFELSSKNTQIKLMSEPISYATYFEVQNIRKNALNMKSKAETLFEKIEQRAQEVKDEVVELYNNNIQKSDRAVAKFDEGYGTTTMEEYIYKDSILRKSVFQNNKLETVEEFSKNGIRQFNYYDNDYLKGINYKEADEYSTDGDIRVKRAASIFGNTSCYCEDVEYSSLAGKRIGKQLILENGKMNEYKEGELYRPDGTSVIAKQMYFDGNEESVEYNKSIERIQGQKCNIGKTLIRDNDEWTQIIN